MGSAPSFPDLRAHLAELFVAARTAVAPGNDDVAIIIERPKQAQHGDYSCNLALQLAKRLKRNPRDVATALIAALPVSPHVAKADIAGAGFINLFLHPQSQQAVVPHILTQGTTYGTRQAVAARKVQLEFVSANPTGPLHVGHGRGAAYGASLANLLTATGHQVTREYYINDAGRQMDILALSTWLRYLELHKLPIAFPPNGYQGSYVVEMAQSLQAAHGERFLLKANADLLSKVPGAEDEREAHLDALIGFAKQQLGVGYADLHRHVLDAQLTDLREDLAEFGVAFDVWFSEQSLFDSGRVSKAVAQLDAAGHLYQEAGAKWFRSTAFGDEKDRVVQRDNGQYTYFASDIAYHLDKFARGFERIIDIWGADHHGYQPRVKGALQALGLPVEKLDIALVQFAVLYRGKEKVSMSTRAGEFVTLRELRREVGNDAARFFYVLRKSDQHLDFDLELAKAHTNDNPVYYIQYAHARICSALGQWGGNVATLANADISLLNEPAEAALLSRLIDYPDVLANAARDLAPHAVAFYLKDLAADFHSYYNATRLLVDDEPLKRARLALATSVRTVIGNALAVLGVSAPEKM